MVMYTSKVSPETITLSSKIEIQSRCWYCESDGITSHYCSILQFSGSWLPLDLLIPVIDVVGQ